MDGGSCGGVEGVSFVFGFYFLNFWPLGRGRGEGGRYIFRGGTGGVESRLWGDFRYDGAG